jgi:UDP-N-acetylglucosamine 2-epimerase (non-hydrolysing)
MIVEDLVAVSTIAPVHFVLHPATQRRLHETGLLGILEQAPGIRLAPRMPYTGFLALLANARGVFSDGGSNQEELSYLGVPTVLYRERTERPDGLGRNVVFVKDVHVPVPEFVRTGEMDRLRAESLLNAHASPSAVVVGALHEWASN